MLGRGTILSGLGACAFFTPTLFHDISECSCVQTHGLTKQPLASSLLLFICAVLAARPVACSAFRWRSWMATGRARKKRSRTSQNKSIADVVPNQGLGRWWWQRRRRCGGSGRPHRRHKGSPIFLGPCGSHRATARASLSERAFRKEAGGVRQALVCQPGSITAKSQRAKVFSVPPRLSLSIRDDDAHTTADACLHPACSPRCRKPWRNSRCRADPFQGQGWRCERKPGYLWRTSSSLNACSQDSDFD